jgi:hypothetical protein
MVAEGMEKIIVHHWKNGKPIIIKQIRGSNGRFRAKKE